MTANGAGTAVAARPREVTEVHTRILRVTLAEPECRAYWENVELSVEAPKRAAIAFEQRWFGAKSMARVQTLVAALSERFDPFPEALSVLHAWRGMNAATRVACGATAGHGGAPAAGLRDGRRAARWLPTRRRGTLPLLHPTHPEPWQTTSPRPGDPGHRFGVTVHAVM